MPTPQELLAVADKKFIEQLHAQKAAAVSSTRALPVSSEAALSISLDPWVYNPPPNWSSKPLIQGPMTKQMRKTRKRYLATAPDPFEQEMRKFYTLQEQITRYSNELDRIPLETRKHIIKSSMIDRSGRLLKDQIDEYLGRELREVRAKNHGYPFGGVLSSRMKLAAIYTPNPELLDGDTVWQLRADAQTSSHLATVPLEILILVLNHLMMQHGPVSKLAATCQLLFRKVGESTTLWDITRPDYRGCDANPGDYKPCSNKIACFSPKPVTPKFRDCRVFRPCEASPPCFIGEDRQGYCHGCSEKLVLRTTEADFSPRVIVTAFYRGKGKPPSPFELDDAMVYPYMSLRSCFDALKVTWQSLNSYAHAIEYLDFHKIPMLTISQLELFIRDYPKLKKLGIYSCQMVTIGHLPQLIELITSIPYDRVDALNPGFGHILMTAKKVRPVIELDFYPIMQRGPKEKRVNGVDGEGKECYWKDPRFEGDWGATYNVFYVVGQRHSQDNRLAVLGLLYRLRNKLKLGKVNLFSKDAAFRQWLLDFGLTEEYIDQFAFALNISERMPTKEWAEQFAPKMVPRTNIRMFYDNAYLCVHCEETVPGIFWDGRQFRPNVRYESDPPTFPCLACTMWKQLNVEDDHFKSQIKYVIHNWLAHTLTGSDAFGPVALNNAHIACMAKSQRIEQYKRQQIERGQCMWPQFKLPPRTLELCQDIAYDDKKKGGFW